MKHDIGSKNVVYAISDEKLVYEVREYETYAERGYIQWSLDLVAGKDYVDPDHSNKRGWVPASNFVEDVHHEFINQYICRESLRESLEMWGFEVLFSKDLTPDLLSVITTSKMSREMYEVIQRRNQEGN